MTACTVCTFTVGELHVGLPIDDVQEVLPDLPITPAPRGPDGLLGLVNMRGRIVTVHDLRRHLGQPPAAVDEPGLNVVVRHDGEPSSLRVDDVGDVLVLEASEIEPTPPTLTASDRRAIRGVCKLPTHLLLILDARSLLTRDVCQGALS